MSGLLEGALEELGIVEDFEIVAGSLSSTAVEPEERSNCVHSDSRSEGDSIFVV